MAFRPYFARVRIIAILALVALVALALLLAAQMLAARPVGPKTVILLGLFLPVACLGLLLAWRVWQLFGLDYWIDRDALRIHWAGDLITLPLGQITAIVPYPSRPPLSIPGPRWQQWPLTWVQRRQPGNCLAVYATQPPADCLAVELSDCTYLVSPRDPAAFLAAFHSRQDFGALRELPEQLEFAAIHEHWLRRDRLAQFLLIAGLLAGLALFSYFLWQYPALPEQTPLHFDARGLVDRIGPRRALMLLPSVALLIWFFDAVMGLFFYERRPLAAYLLWGNALVVQIAGLLIGRNLIQLMS